MLRIVVTALAASLICMDLLAGLAIVTLGAVFLLLRNTGDQMVFIFCLSYQWMFIVTGFVYQDFTGAYPKGAHPGSLGVAVALLLFALVAMAAGLRAGILCCERLAGRPLARLAARPADYNANKLFWLVIVLFTASWLMNSSPREFAYSISQILLAGLAFRFVFLYMLFVAVLQQGRGYLRAIIALLFVMIPTFLSGMSQFKECLFMFLLAMIGEISRRGGTPRWNRRIKRVALAAVCMALSLVPLGLIWNGAIKPAWRPQVQGATPLEGSTWSNLGAFFATTVKAVAEMDWGASVDSLAGRFANAPYLFSLVVDRVPSEVPYEDGALIWRGLRHILMPRFLFPDKINLGSDSWLVRKYAGVAAAGEESNTSIGLCYLAEYYIDFGPLGMLLAAFCFGWSLGLACRGLALLAPSLPIYRGALAVPLISAFMGLESNFAKLLGALVMMLVVCALLLKTCGPRLHSALRLPATRRPGQSRIRERVAP
jgi:hypothetical protein